MGTKHTDGPWWFEFGDNGKIDILYRDEPYNRDFSVLSVGLCGQEANARLIAAAPDLLRALAQLELAVTDIRGIDMESYCGSELDQARTAITKATRHVPD